MQPRDSFFVWNKITAVWKLKLKEQQYENYN